VIDRVIERELDLEEDVAFVGVQSGANQIDVAALIALVPVEHSAKSQKRKGSK
jgi:hypothetical protein